VRVGVHRHRVPAARRHRVGVDDLLDQPLLDAAHHLRGLDGDLGEPDPAGEIGADAQRPLLPFVRGTAQVGGEQGDDVGVVEAGRQLVGEAGTSDAAAAGVSPTPDRALALQGGQVEPRGGDVDVESVGSGEVIAKSGCACAVGATEAATNSTVTDATYTRKKLLTCGTRI
jgi:hypothetical protein